MVLVQKMNRLNHQLKQIHTSIVGLTGNGLTEEKLINLINMNSSADSQELITENVELQFIQTII